MAQTQKEIQSTDERLFLNSVASRYTKDSYKMYLQKYLDICGYKDTNELSLDKEQTSYSDSLDALRLACKMYPIQDLA